MAALIKADCAAAITRLPTVTVERQRDLADPRIAVLQAEIERLEIAAEETAYAHVVALAKMREQGRSEIAADDNRRLAAIEAALDGARAQWEERLAGMDALAARLAHVAVGRIFGEDADLPDLVVRTTTAHVARIGKSAVVRVHVCPQDFPATDAIARRLTVLAEQVVLDPLLEPGEARLDVALGHVDLSIHRQWQAIGAVLHDLAEPAGTAA